MKNNSAIETALKNEAAMRAVPELIVDWNMNRYVGAVADNTPAETLEAYNGELFPIESIVANNRPKKGINKARIGSSTISDDYAASTTGSFSTRFYVADEDDVYKYWTSPKPTDTSGNVLLFNATNFPTPDGETYTYDNLSSVRPRVIYNTATAVNKIVITTENTWATAKTFQIQVTTSATPAEGDWTTVADNTSLGNSWKASGQIVLWYNGNGPALTPWVTTGRVDNSDKSPKTVTIRGVRMVVTALEGGYRTNASNTLVPTTYGVQGTTYTTATTDGKESFFDLIEISARLEVDLSPYVIAFSDTLDMAEKSRLYPIGTVTSNEATITLSNLYKNVSGTYVPGLFSADNADSPYRNFIDANAEMTMNILYYDDDDNFLGKVQEFKMYSESWTGQAEDTVTVDLMDYSKFFNSADIELRPAMWEGLTVPEIIWRILDSIGFVDYQIDIDADRVTNHIIPVFYINGERNVWEVLDELSKASQTAIYFDSYGKLQVKTRDFAFSAADAPVWDFTSEDSAEQLANIVSCEVDSEFEPNHYKITYQASDWAPEKNNMPTLQQVWNPDSESVVLRASPLRHSLPAGQMYFWLDPAEAKVWQYEGLVNIEGEIIRYKGKQFVYYTGPTAAVQNKVWINSVDEYNTRNEMTPIDYRHKNHLSGAIKVSKRGEWNTQDVAHNVEASGYSVRQIVGGTRYTNMTLYHDKAHSRVQLISPPRFASRADIKLATRGSSIDTAFFNYGTRMRFLKQAGRTHQSAGLVIHNDTASEDGYYFELLPSRFLNAKSRKSREEFLFYAREGGNIKVLGTRAVAVGENIDYELDIDFRVSIDGNHVIHAFVNGKLVLDAIVTGADRVAANGRFGMFLRGRTRVEYEYLYAIKRPEESPLLEDFGFLDKVERGYMGGQWDREWVYRVTDFKGLVVRPSVKAFRKHNRQFFDEFGPIAHEIREFDVKFDPKPVLHSRLYMSNDWAACALEYIGNPFGAKFIIANTSRRNAVLNGEDSLSFAGTGASINQVLTVFARVLVVSEAEEVIAENTDQIRRRGKVESEITSQWVQSKEMADELAEWLRDNFSYGNDQLTLEVFGNTLLEVGDVVTVNYPTKHISGEFFITGIQNDFEEGLSSVLTLRRRSV